MPVFHCHASYVKKGKGSAAAFGRYLAREGREEGAQFHRYLVRENGQGKDDLVAHDHANLPTWAQNDPAYFWQMADRLERKNGIVARHLEIALPRELSPEGRQALADDIREVTVGRFPHSWAIHEPMAKDDSGIMPHIHILFSPRREDVDLGRTVEQWFKQPNHGGVGKDASWEAKSRLYDVREAVALLTNAALSREGIEAAVDQRTLKAQGLERAPARYGDRQQAEEVKGLSAAERKELREAEMQRTEAYRKELRTSGVHDYEQLHTYGGGQDQAVKLLSLDRTYVRDLARDHVWRFDRSPARELERQQSLERTLTLAMEERTPHQTLERHRRQERTHERQRASEPDVRTPSVAQRVRELAASLGHDDEAVGGVAVRVKLFERERDEDRDMSW